MDATRTSTIALRMVRMSYGQDTGELRISITDKISKPGSFCVLTFKVRELLIFVF